MQEKYDLESDLKSDLKSELTLKDLLNYEPKPAKDKTLNERYSKIVLEATKKYSEYLKMDDRYRTKRTIEEIEEKRERMKKNPLIKGTHPDDRHLEPKPNPVDIPLISGINFRNVFSGHKLLEPVFDKFEEKKDFSQKKQFDIFRKLKNKLFRSKKFENLAITLMSGRQGLVLVNLDTKLTYSKYKKIFMIQESIKINLFQ